MVRQSPLPEYNDKQKKLLFERISSVMKTVSRKSHLEIRDSLSVQEKKQLMLQGMDPNTTWFRQTQHHPKTREVVREFIYVPTEMTKIPEEEALGKAAHEAGHVAQRYSYR